MESTMEDDGKGATVMYHDKMTANWQQEMRDRRRGELTIAQVVNKICC